MRDVSFCDHDHGLGLGYGSRAREARAGFTLIELVVVTALIALVFLVALARFDHLLPRYRIRAAAREMGALMKQARSRALGSGKDVYLVYDLSEDRFWLLVAFPDEEEERDPDEPPPVKPQGFIYERVFERKLTNGIHIQNIIVGHDRTEDAGQVFVRLSPYGMGEHHIVNLYDEGDRKIAVRFNGFTGYLTFYDEHRGPEELLEDEGP